MFLFKISLSRLISKLSLISISILIIPIGKKNKTATLKNIATFQAEQTTTP